MWFRKKKLIMRTFYINVDGLTRQQAEQQIYELMKEYSDPDLPNDIRKQYHFEDIWLPITGGDCRVEFTIV